MIKMSALLFIFAAIHDCAHHSSEVPKPVPWQKEGTVGIVSAISFFQRPGLRAHLPFCFFLLGYAVLYR